ncbi:MAG: transketolase [Hyphomicrobiaceae bacterium]|nr:transketolase [Hyphomicrobiaceae bacterium]MCC0007830.1 transketolase [Hyphomicrobiaceae bacterium]
MTGAEANGVTHKDMANAIRALAMDAVQAANSGHPGMPMGMADVATVLFTRFLRYDPASPDWPNRDRFVLSAGHGSMLLYALLHLTGYPGMTIDELKRFRQLGAKTAGHPEYGHAAGIETTTGPLGQGIANAVGMAIAERLKAARLGSELVDHHTYVIAGDGCLMEGISHEAISLAGHLKLGKLIVLFDDNGICIDGATSLAESDDQCARFAASGWNTMRIDGHDAEAIAAALAKAHADTSRPWLIACKTIIGKGAPNRQGTAKTHGEPLGAEEIAATRANIGWDSPPFVIPEPIRAAWLAAGTRGAAEHAAWQAKLDAAGEAAKAAFAMPAASKRAETIDAAVAAAKAAFAADTAKRATRQWSQLMLEHLVPVVPEMIGGSADLTGSNLTRTKTQKAVSSGDFSGSYIHYGVREHGMAAAMNGIALSGGLIPYGGTFLVFTDYCRPSIRLSALMKQRVIYVMTHDSIGLGEDGPTHQPVEHLAALRAIPNLQVLRPADPIETAECWQLALKATDRPTVLALTRQAVPLLRADSDAENRSERGGYVLREASGARDVTLLATGSEVGLAVEAAALLGAENIKAAVVSLPSFELFRAQDAGYRDAVLGSAPRIGIEAAIEMGWRQWLRPQDRFVGLDDFGASAPAGALFKHFGITTERIAALARELSGRA